MLAFGISGSGYVTIPNHRSWSFEGCVCSFVFLSSTFAYFGVFLFYFSKKKGIVLLMGLGFWGTLCVWGDYWGVYFICSSWKCLSYHFWGISGWKKNSWFVIFFSLSQIFHFPTFSLGVFEENFFSSHFHFSLLLYLLSFPAHGGRSLAHHVVYGWISVSKYLGLYASLRILGWVGCLNTEL